MNNFHDKIAIFAKFLWIQDFVRADRKKEEMIISKS